jgi:transcriptional regulator with XRE-family HTH domain
VQDPLAFRLAERVRQIRKRLKLTQAALAARAGVTVETVARLERVLRGRSSANSNPSLDTLSRLSSALGVELHELLAPRFEPHQRSDALGHLLEGADPVVVQRILRVAEALVREEQGDVHNSSIRQVTRPTRAGTTG